MQISPLQKPFPFELLVGENTLSCQKLLRTVPENRMVIAGEWKNRPVLAKIFLKPFPRAWLEFKRETRGTKALLAARIPTPTILYAGRLKDSGAFIILFELLPETIEFSARFEKTTLRIERLSFLRELVEIIAKQHQAGIIQMDMHFKNFLYTDQHLYSVDTGCIHLEKKPLDLKKSLRFFALFLTELSLMENSLRSEAIIWYLNLRGFLSTPQILIEIDRQEIYWQKKREQKLRSKLFRSSTHLVSEKDTQQFWVCQRRYLSDELRSFLNAPEYLFLSPAIQLIKTGKTTTVATLQLADQCLLVKRYNAKNLWYQLKRTFTRTRAKKSWENAHRLRFRGIQTPMPVAMIETYEGRLKGTSYFISEYISGTTASEYFTPHHFDPIEGRVIAQRILDVLKKLVQEKICHRDLKASNILINNKNVSLIDLDAMKFYHNKYFFNHRAKKDMDRFMRNWQGQPLIKRLFEL